MLFFSFPISKDPDYKLLNLIQKVIHTRLIKGFSKSHIMKKAILIGWLCSRSWARTSDPLINSQML